MRLPREGELCTYVLAVPWALPLRIPIATVSDRYCYSHVTGEETGFERCEVICLRSPSTQGHEPGLKSKVQIQNPCFSPTAVVSIDLGMHSKQWAFPA